MAAQSVFPAGVFPADASLSEEGPGLGGLPGDTLPAPQLVLLANVAALTAAEAGGDEGSVADEAEMMELKTVGSSYLDSEDESVIRYGYNSQSHREVCVVDYPESPRGRAAGDEERLRPPQPHAADVGSKRGAEPATGGAKKKKPFRCKPCRFQARDEQEFTEHLGSHGASKMMVVSQVEGRSRSREAETPEATAGAEPPSADAKGLIRCERCGYNTNRYDHYIAHLKHHSKEGDNHRVFKCTLCPYTTVSQYHWRKHLRNHFPSKLHTCSQCSYFSDRKSNYVQHIRTHTGVRPFRCLYCDYSSSQKTHLTRHMRTHSGERPFKCENCPYLAANQHEVTRHARQVHNGPKPLSCPYCEYKTADRSNFKKHVELHLNPRQFLCPLCKYAASKKCNLQYHIKSRHSGCHITLDVSKVKLRVKRSGPDAAQEAPDTKGDRRGGCAVPEEDVEDGDDDSSPINLSVRKSGRSGAGQPDRKPNLPAEKPHKAKEPEKKTGGRPKKRNESPAEDVLTRDAQTETAVDRVRKRVRKGLAVKAEEPGTRTQLQSSDPQPARDPTPEPKGVPEKKNLSRPRRSKKNPRDNHDGPGRNQNHDGPVKRKAPEALDLSQKSSKSRRLKTSGDKLRPRPADGTGAGPAPPKQKKARTAGRRAPGGSAQVQNPATTATDPPGPEEPPPAGTGPADQASGPPGPGPAPPGRRGRPADLEDDEGIHSSHEGGSDISDSASEGSDDSGLNGNAAAPGKMADPDTPTDGVPTPTQLKSHTCIFCDRTFPLEAAYRRHLNRHLVNVYYMDTAETRE